MKKLSVMILPTGLDEQASSLGHDEAAPPMPGLAAECSQAAERKAAAAIAMGRNRIPIQ